MNLSQIAKELGRKGGKARAKKLSSRERRKIASLGGRVRVMARYAEQRVADNFRFLQTVETLRKIARVYDR